MHFPPAKAEAAARQGACESHQPHTDSPPSPFIVPPPPNAAAAGPGPPSALVAAHAPSPAQASTGHHPPRLQPPQQQHPHPHHHHHQHPNLHHHHHQRHHSLASPSQASPSLLSPAPPAASAPSTLPFSAARTRRGSSSSSSSHIHIPPRDSSSIGRPPSTPTARTPISAAPSPSSSSTVSACSTAKSASIASSTRLNDPYHQEQQEPPQDQSQDGHQPPPTKRPGLAVLTKPRRISSGLGSATPSSTVHASSGSWGPSSGTHALVAAGMAARPLSLAASISMPANLSEEAAVSSLSLSASVGSSPMHMRRPSTPHTPSSPPTRTSSLGASYTRASHVQAVHNFDPSIMPTGALTHNMYLTFRSGEVIRVHGRDPSGWWDGEVSGTNGEQVRRGWFPSNYVREVNWDELYGKNPAPPFVGPSASHPAVAAVAAEGRSRQSVISYGSHGSHLSHHSSQPSSGSHVSRASSSTTDPNNPFGPPPNLSYGLQTLFQPIVQSLTLLQNSIQEGNLAHIQPSTAAVISAIRIALVRMDCMGRDSTVLSANPVLSKERRYVLAELSKLVACAKLTADADPEGDATTALESTGRAARSVFSWVRRFMMHASETGVDVLALDNPEASPNPSNTNGSGEPQQRLRMGGAAFSARMAQQDPLRMKSASVSDLRATARRQGSGMGAPPIPSSSSSSIRPSSRGGHAMGMSPSLGSGRSSPIPFQRGGSSSQRHIRSTSFEQYSGISIESSVDSPDLDASSELSHSTMSHSMSRRGRPESGIDQDAFKDFVSGVAVHEAIATAEDALLSIIASFIGHIHSHHIDSHPSSHAYLIELTRETVDRVRDLLTIVEAVGRQAGTLGVLTTEVENLRSSRAALYHATTRLVEGAEAVANAPFAEGGSEAYDAEKAELLQVTTTTLRAGTECARIVRTCVPEDPGDSDYDSPSLGSSVNGRASPQISSRYSVVGLGIRGPHQHQMSTLSRRATSLGQMHRRYHQDGGVYAGSSQRRPRMDDDNEEIVADESADENDFTAPRRAPRPTSQPPGTAYSTDIVSDPTRTSESGGSRSRAASLSVPRRIGHKSPSASVDLDKDASASASNKSRPSTTQHTPGSEAQDTPVLDTQSPDANGDTIELKSPIGPAPRAPVPARADAVSAAEEGGEMRFWVVAHDYDPREVAFNSDGVLVGGSLRVLVEKMTPHDGMPDNNFSAAFWYTFRLFCTPTELVETLVARYELKPPPVVAGMDQAQLDTWKERKLMPVRLRVYNFMKSWLDQHWRAQTDDAVLDSLEAFARDVVSTTLPAHMSPRLIEQVRKRQAAQSTASESGTTTTKGPSLDRIRSMSVIMHTPVGPSVVPTPIITKTLHGQLMKNPAPTNISILDFDTVELARQLTIMESKLFAAVAPEDLLMTGKKSIPELKALSTLSNQITGWVADNILNEQDPKHRAALLKFYIKLADKCLMLNNFSTLFAVLAGLNSSTIMRLKKTWDVLSVKYRVLMERLRGVIEHTKNHAAYRARLRDVTGPCLPFLGLILSDITFTQDGNPNTRPSTLSPDLQLINQDKFTKLGRIAADFRRYQMPFDLKELEPVQGFLQRVLAERGSGSLDALYRKSLLLEPRQGSERLSQAVEKPGWLGVKLQV